MADLARRGFLGGLVALAAPAIIRTPGLLMPLGRRAPIFTPSRVHDFDLPGSLARAGDLTEDTVWYAALYFQSYRGALAPRFVALPSFPIRETNGIA